MSMQESLLREALFRAVHKLEEVSGYVRSTANSPYADEIKRAAQRGRQALADHEAHRV